MPNDPAEHDSNWRMTFDVGLGALYPRCESASPWCGDALV